MLKPEIINVRPDHPMLERMADGQPVKIAAQLPAGSIVVGQHFSWDAQGPLLTVTVFRNID